jgi:dihydroorotase
MIGLETALSIVTKTIFDTGLLTWSAIADRMSYAPARIGRYVEHGQEIRVGAPAHLTVINPTKSIRVDRDLVSSRSRNTPFHGMELPGVVMATFFKGNVSYKAGAQ